MQKEHLGVIEKEFDGQVRALIPLYDSDIRGVAMLEKAGTALFA
jgi:hypothetical protein